MDPQRCRYVTVTVNLFLWLNLFEPLWFKEVRFRFASGSGPMGPCGTAALPVRNCTCEPLLAKSLSLSLFLSLSPLTCRVRFLYLNLVTIKCSKYSRAFCGQIPVPACRIQSQLCQIEFHRPPARPSARQRARPPPAPRPSPALRGPQPTAAADRPADRPLPPKAIFLGSSGFFRIVKTFVLNVNGLK